MENISIKIADQSNGKPEIATTDLNQEKKESRRDLLNISKIVNYLLLLLGLSAEFFAIRNIIGEIPAITSHVSIYNITLASVVVMLVHQFLIIRNFHILDHSNNNDLTLIGNWVGKCIIEDILRLLLFISFALLTGEIFYLLIVGSKFFDFFKTITQIDTNGKFDLKWMTPYYIYSALFMSILMLVWDILGWIHDYPDLPKTKFAKINTNVEIVYFPFNNPFLTFTISDFFSFTFWILIYLIVFLNQDEAANLMILLFLLYLGVIVIRIYAELRVNIPRFKSLKASYKQNTYWWRPAK